MNENARPARISCALPATPPPRQNDQPARPPWLPSAWRRRPPHASRAGQPRLTRRARFTRPTHRATGCETVQQGNLPKVIFWACGDLPRSVFRAVGTSPELPPAAFFGLGHCPRKRSLGRGGPGITVVDDFTREFQVAVDCGEDLSVLRPVPLFKCFLFFPTRFLYL